MKHIVSIDSYLNENTLPQLSIKEGIKYINNCAKYCSNPAFLKKIQMNAVTSFKAKPGQKHQMFFLESGDTNGFVESLDQSYCLQFAVKRNINNNIHKGYYYYIIGTKDNKPASAGAFLTGINEGELSNVLFEENDGANFIYDNFLNTKIFNEMETEKAAINKMLQAAYASIKPAKV